MPSSETTRGFAAGVVIAIVVVVGDHMFRVTAKLHVHAK